ncbi:MAG: hypothetical protein IPL23_07885 [Saprospiraceae bacterium]|nr:hypothetical protein [Saprospiraceae bacterium]
MYKFLTKHGTAAAFGLGLVCTIAFMASALAGLGADGYDASTDLVGLGKDKIPAMQYFDLGLYLTLALLVVCVIALFAFMILDIFKFPKSSVKGLLGFGVLVIIFFVLKSISKVEIGPIWTKLANDFAVTEGVSKTISGGIWTTLLLMATAAIVMVVSEIRNFFK